jgi:uncharacterized protein (TIGR02246 family)
MFERYTEKARRVIFFARYEATQYGSRQIETEHLLLGIIRESAAALRAVLPENISFTNIRQKIELSTIRHKTRISTSMEIPLSIQSRNILRHAAEEADRLRDRHIGPEHLLLGMLCEKAGLGFQVLREFGVELEASRAAAQRGRLGTDATAVKSVMVALQDAWNRHSAVEFDDLFDPEAEYGAANGVVWRGRRNIRSALEALLDAESGESTATLAECEVNMLRPDFAVARARWEITGDRSRGERVSTQMLLVLSYEDEEWKIVSAQSTNVPPKP